jgi:hypothetical protein
MVFWEKRDISRNMPCFVLINGYDRVVFVKEDPELFKRIKDDPELHRKADGESPRIKALGSISKQPSVVTSSPGTAVFY